MGASKIKREHVKVEYEDIESEVMDVKEEINEKKVKKVPENWEMVLANLREMRKNSDAPVDSMGCDKCMDDDAPAVVCFINLFLKNTMYLGYIMKNYIVIDT